MPLRATLNNDDVLAPYLDDAAWASLKQGVKQEQLDLRLPCCGQVAYLRTSKQGVKHFVHKERDNCTSAPETWQHLKVKQEIVLACRTAGFSAITEAVGDGWRADVLAVKDKAKIAFEVQWSSQTWEITQERQERYKAAGIRGCWFFKRPPVQYQAMREVPLFKLEVIDGSATIIFNSIQDYHWSDNYDRRIVLSDFVGALLTGRIRFCKQLRTLRQQKARIVFVETDCWKCRRSYHVYYVDHFKTGCGHTLEADFFAQEIITKVLQFKNSPQGQHLRIGQIKKRYSNTVQERYKSFGCPHCDALCGDFFLRHEILPEAQYHEDKAPATLETEIFLNELSSEECHHWCFPETGKFCC